MIGAPPFVGAVHATSMLFWELGADTVTPVGAPGSQPKVFQGSVTSLSSPTFSNDPVPNAASLATSGEQ